MQRLDTYLQFCDEVYWHIANLTTDLTKGKR